MVFQEKGSLEWILEVLQLVYGCVSHDGLIEEAERCVMLDFSGDSKRSSVKSFMSRFEATNERCEYFDLLEILTTHGSFTSFAQVAQLQRAEKIFLVIPEDFQLQVLLYMLSQHVVSKTAVVHLFFSYNDAFSWISSSDVISCLSDILLALRTGCSSEVLMNMFGEACKKIDRERDHGTVVRFKPFGFTMS